MYKINIYLKFSHTVTQLGHSKTKMKIGLYTFFAFFLYSDKSEYFTRGIDASYRQTLDRCIDPYR